MAEEFSTLFTEPNLLIPGEKPVGDVRLVDGSNAFIWLFRDNFQPVERQGSVNNGATLGVGLGGLVASFVASNTDYISAGILSLRVESLGWIQVKYATTSSARQNLYGGGGSGTGAAGEPFRFTLNYQPGVGGATAGYVGLSPQYSYGPRA